MVVKRLPVSKQKPLLGASAVAKAKPLMEEMARSVPLAPPHAGG